ncbi:MAG: tripartite tricarboxylate transporter substrate binding protein [Variovorax sp.]|nr:tripartite tricarboxylate transporter substrate binding protein [Variovorax sp.]
MKPSFRDPISRGRRVTLMAMLAGALPTLARAQAYPARAIKLVVTQAAGSGSDVIARLVGDRLAEALKQPVIVENRPGASGIIGHQFVLGAPHDGYTLLMSSTANLLVVPVMASNARFRYTDFTPVAALLESAYVVVVANAPGKPSTLKELLDAGRTRPLSFASSGTGSMGHLGAELILERAGSPQRHVHVPYRGSAQALADVVGGQAAFAVDTLLAAEPLIKGGRLRALAVTSAHRLDSLPEVPTLQEAGLPDMDVTTKAGIFAPSDVPPVVVTTISTAVSRILAEPNVRATLRSLGNEPSGLSPAQYQASLSDEAPAWERLVRRLDLRME